MNVKNLVIGIGIFVVYLMMLHYGIEAFYPSPQYDAYCQGTSYYGYGREYPITQPGTEGPKCSFSASLLEQERDCYNQKGVVIYSYDDRGCAQSLECNFCQRDYEEDNKGHSQNVFLVALIVGIATLVLGFFISMDPVGSSLMASGVGAMFYGSTRNWQNLSDIWRFLLLFIALVLLIWFALKLNKSTKGKSKWMFWK